MDKAFFEELLKLIRLVLQMRNSFPNSTDPKDDYIVSPVKNSDGKFYDSRTADSTLPCDADANGAYNIARKGLWTINRIRTADESEYLTVTTAMSKAEWLKYCQENNE